MDCAQIQEMGMYNEGTNALGVEQCVISEAPHCDVEQI